MSAVKRKKPSKKPPLIPKTYSAVRATAIKKNAAVPESEFSDPFIQGMFDRMAVSYFKYGKVAVGYPEKVDAVASLVARLVRYVGTERVTTAVAVAVRSLGAKLEVGGDGNTEWLMDVANFAMIEYMRPRHTKAHFKGTDGDTQGRLTTRGINTSKHNLDLQ